MRSFSVCPNVSYLLTDGLTQTGNCFTASGYENLTKHTHICVSTHSYTTEKKLSINYYRLFDFTCVCKKGLTLLKQNEYPSKGNNFHMEIYASLLTLGSTHFMKIFQILRRHFPVSLCKMAAKSSKYIHSLMCIDLRRAGMKWPEIQEKLPHNLNKLCQPVNIRISA